MPSFLLLDKCRTFHGLTGQLLPGGYVRFYESDGTTDADVYGDRDLSTNNGNIVALDASSRLQHECWADTADAFFCELYDEDDVKQGEISYMEVPGGAQQSIPIPNEGEFITGDGTNYLLETIVQVPDMTGQIGKILGTDGTLPLWVVKPADGADGVSDITSGTGYTKLGSLLIQRGTGTAPATGTDASSVTVTFPTAFGTAPYHFEATPTVATVNGVSLVADSYTGASTTGCTANFNNADRHYDGSSKLTVAIPFTWVAYGPAP